MPAGAWKLIIEDDAGKQIVVPFTRDVITIDAVRCEIGVELSGEELARRKAAWQTPSPKATTGVLAKYIRLLQPASQRCVTD